MPKLSKSQKEEKFKLVSPYSPAGDQGKVINQMTESLEKENREQTILGVTGSGKTYMMASIVNNLQRPTLVIAHNKTLAAQLAEEFRRFFPDNAVHYFVSYYDYYQPESYLPRSDTYIEKQTQINEEIDRLRNAATQALLTRRDVLIVASVSCIYGLGDPKDFEDLKLELQVGETYNLNKLTRRLITLQFSRTSADLNRGQFRIKGESLELIPKGEENGYRFNFFGDELEEIASFNPINNEILEKLDKYTVFPAAQFVTSKEKIKNAIEKIQKDMEERVELFEKQEKFVEAQRIKERASNDIEMLQHVGFVGGIENYSIYFDGRNDGEAPSTLIDYFPEDFLCFIDESHMTLPQIGAMYAGDRSRKGTLVDYGFRLPSAMNNRPLKLAEFFESTNQLVYVSATPADFELGYGDIPKTDEITNAEKFIQLKKDFVSEMENAVIARRVSTRRGNPEELPGTPILETIYKANPILDTFCRFTRIEEKIQEILDSKISKDLKIIKIQEAVNDIQLTFELEKILFPLKKEKALKVKGEPKNRDVLVSEAIIRPTGLIDPEIIIKPVKNQVDDVLEQVRKKVEKGQRVLITTLTKKFAEELDIYFKEIGIKSAYIHSDVDTMERIDIIADLRRGYYDVLIGINLLREGLDLPEVGLIAIFDADKEGFLRSRTSLIQIVGRAARHTEGQVIMYADTITRSMKEAIDETDRRRAIQIAHNKKHGITATNTKRELETIADDVRKEIEEEKDDLSLRAKRGNPEQNTWQDNKEDFPIENRFEKKKAKLKTAGQQAYTNFEQGKEESLKALKKEKLSKKQLEKRLQKAVNAMDFEQAAAIRDLLNKS